MDLSKEVLDAYEKAKTVRKNAHAPYSDFKVGVALKLKDKDELFLGCNVENASFGATVCAERNALFQSIAKYGKQRPEFIVVVTQSNEPAVPCALCLQVLAEFDNPELDIYLANLDKITAHHKMKEFLPHPFNNFEV